jgi:chromosome segregation ATPase
MEEFSHEELLEVPFRLPLLYTNRQFDLLSFVGSQYAIHLQQQIDDRDNEIADLTQSQTGKSKGKRGANFTQKEELEALEAENEDLRSQVEAAQLSTSDLREQLSNANVRVTTLQNEKAEADKKIRLQTKRLEELEKEIVEVTNKGRTAELQSKEISKQKSKNVQEVQQLWDENATLNDEVLSVRILMFLLTTDVVFPMLILQIKQLEAQLRAADEEKAFMEGLIAKLADEKDDLASKVDAADIEMDAVQTARIEQEKLLMETQLRLQVRVVHYSPRCFPYRHTCAAMISCLP